MNSINVNNSVFNQLGRVVLSKELVHEIAMDDKLRAVFGANFFVLRAEYHMISDSIEYTCYSPLFKVLEYGECMLDYDVLLSKQVNKNEDITYNITVGLKNES